MCVHNEDKSLLFSEVYIMRTSLDTILRGVHNEDKSRHYSQRCTSPSPCYSQRCNRFNLFPCFFRAQAPQGVSNYVGNILKPLMSLQGEIPANYEQQWRTSIIEMVTGRYNNNNCIIMCKQ